MIFEIDTHLKTVRMKSQDKFCDIINELKKVIGKDWKEYSLIPYEEKWQYYEQPYITNPCIPYPYISPLELPITVCGNSDTITYHN